MEAARMAVADACELDGDGGDENRLPGVPDGDSFAFERELGLLFPDDCGELCAAINGLFSCLSDTGLEA